jgi:DNA-binding CsgD family transcriptional regulator
MAREQPDARARVGRASAVADSATLIGRDEELAWASARVVPGAGVVVAGEAGVGKTRLIDVLAARERANGAEVVRVVGTPSLRDVPLGALAWMLPLSSGVAGVAGSAGASEGFADRLTAACAALLARAGDRALLLVLDDAHWLDDPTVVVARQLLMAGAASVMATVRSGEPAGQPLTALWKDELCERLDLQPLSTAQVAALAEQQLGGPVEPAAVARLAEVTAGNPLYIRELVAQLTSTGTLAPTGTGWTWMGDRPLVVGDRLAELLASRIGALSRPAAELAAMVALGEPVPTAALRHLADHDAVSEAHDRGLLVTDPGPPAVVRLQHPLFGAALLGTRADLVGYLGRLSEAFRALVEPTDADRVRAARWALEAGTPRAEELAEVARLVAVVDHAGARRFAAAAVTTADTVGNRLLEVEVLVTALRFEQALACLDIVDRRLADPEVADREPELDLDAARVAAATWRIPCLAYGKGDFDGMAAVVDRFPAEHPGRPMLEAQWAAALAIHGSTAGSARALELLQHADPAVRFRALAAVDLADSLAGRCEACVARAEALLLDAVERDEVDTEARWVLTPMLRGLYLAGRLDEFGRYLDLAAAQVGARVTPPGYVVLPQGRYALAQGRVAASVALLELAVASGRRGEVEPWWLRWATAVLAEAYALLGRVDDARAMAAESETVVSELRQLGPRPEDLDARRSLVWARAACDGLPAGRLAAEAEAQRCRAAGAPMFELLVLHDAVRLGSPARAAVDRVAELAATIEGRWPAPITDHVRGMADDDPAALEAATEGFAAIGSMLVAAEAADRAAASYRRAGDSAGARRLEARAGALVAACEGTRSPALTAASAPTGLTKREAAVASLAAAGHSSKDIAERLFVSVRTVDNHLGRVYAKLGVRNRRDLAARLDQQHGPE